MPDLQAGSLIVVGRALAVLLTPSEGVIRMTDPQAGGKPNPGTPADKRLKPNKPKK